MKNKANVMYVHSRMCLLASIIKIAYDYGIKVFNTIHFYGFLCQKRLMLDSARVPCQGPTDLDKCVRCTGKLNINKMQFAARMNNTSTFFYNTILKTKKIIDNSTVTNSNKIEKTQLGSKIDIRVKRGLE